MKRLLPGLWLVLLLSGTVQAGDPGGATVAVLAKTGSSRDGSPLPAYPIDMPEISILRITIPAGTALPLHEQPVINAGVLLRRCLPYQRMIFSGDEYWDAAMVLPPSTPCLQGGAEEVRIFPLLELGAKRSRHLESVLTRLRQEGFAAAIEPVAYEFQKGGNEMLRVIVN